MIEYAKIDHLTKAMTNIIPECGIKIEHGLDVKITGVIYGYWLSLKHPEVNIFFNTLEDLEQHIIRAIHAYTLLQTNPLTHVQRMQKDTLRRMYGNFSPEEMN